MQAFNWYTFYYFLHHIYTMDPLSISLYSIHSSQMRSTLGIASLAISVIGFAQFYSGLGKEKLSKLIVYVLGMALLLTAVMYGFNFSSNFIRFIDGAKIDHRARKDSRLDKDEHDALLDSWKSEAYYHILLISIISLFGFPYTILIIIKLFSSSSGWR